MSGKILMIIIIIIIKKGWQCKTGRERLTPYQFEEPSPTILTHRMKEGLHYIALPAVGAA